MKRVVDDAQLAAVQWRVAQVCKVGGPNWNALLKLLDTLAPAPPARPSLHRPGSSGEYADQLAAQYPGVVIPLHTRLLERAARRGRAR